MPFSAYDPEAVRLLSAAVSEALDFVQRAAAKPFTENETTNISKQIAANLMRVFDLGERDPSALKRAALEGLSATPQPEAGLLSFPATAMRNRKPTLTQYRLYALDARIKMFGPIIEAINDETAFKKAAPLLDSYALEQWQETRFVVRLESGTVPLEALNLTTKGDAADGSPNNT